MKYPAPMSVRFFPVVVFIFLFHTFFISPVYAKGLTFPGTTKKAPPFPKNSTLNVFIQPDPKNKGRDQLLKEGVERWKKTLADRMIKLNVSIGTPPAGTTNPITFKFVGDGVLPNGMEIGAGKNDGAAQPKASPDGKSLVGGESVVRDGLPADTDKQKDTLRNVGEHEMSHILGLGDDPSGAVTRHEQSDAARKLNDEDKKEINGLYGTAQTGGGGKPTGNIQMTAGGSNQGFFSYQFNFTPANAIADPEDPEHVALITLGIDPHLVQSVELPPGWISLIPNENLSMKDSYFTNDDYMVDGAPDPAPWEPSFFPHFIAFRTSSAEALKDGLPAGSDPALSLDHSSLTFKVSTAPSANGTIEVWSGGEVQTVAGPVVPEPASFFLLGMGLLGLRRMKVNQKKSLR